MNLELLWARIVSAGAKTGLNACCLFINTDDEIDAFHSMNPNAYDHQINTAKQTPKGTLGLGHDSYWC